jgi:hypothetical protein
MTQSFQDPNPRPSKADIEARLAMALSFINRWSRHGDECGVCRGTEVCTCGYDIAIDALKTAFKQTWPNFTMFEKLRDRIEQRQRVVS